MADLSILKVAGLYTSANEFSAVPEGALAQADNVVVRSTGVVEPRTGQDQQPETSATKHTFGTTGEIPAAISNFDSTLLVHYAVNLQNDATKLAYYTGSGYTAYSGTYAAPEPTLLRMKFVEAGQNLYFATSEGIKALEVATGTPRASGVFRALAPTVSIPAAAGSWLPTNSAVAYRITWGRLDTHGQLHLGEPSGRAILTNTSGTTRDATVRIPIPVEATTADFFRIYRSENAANATVDPGDELYLVYENQPTAANISAGTITVTDITPEILLYDPSYTNPSQPGGFLQANARPPKARDLTNWGGRVWFANTELQQRLELQLLAPLLTSDMLIIWGQTYTVELSPPASGMGDSFEVNYTGMTSDAQKVQHCAQQLVYAINYRNRLGTAHQNYGDIRATLASGPDDPPGKILIEAKDFQVAAGYLGFVSGGTTAATAIQPVPQLGISVTSASTARTLGNTVTVTTGSAHGFSVGDVVVMTSAGVGATFFYESEDANFPPGAKTVTAVPTSTTFKYTEVGSNVTLSGTYKVHKTTSYTASSNDRCPNRLYFSKIQQPEAVPYLNYLDVGVKNHAIYRIVGLRDRLYVFKPEGIYIVSGEYPFRVDLLDDTAKILAADSVAVVNNAIYFLSNQGVCSVSDAGVKIVSRPIERTILSSNAFTTATPTTFGVGHESERSYYLWLGTDGAQTCYEAYVYCVLTNAWTRWPLERTCGLVLPYDDRLYTGATTNYLFQQRALGDFVDEQYSGSYTISSVSSDRLTLTLNASVTGGVQEGDLALIGAGGIPGLVSSVTGASVILKAVSSTSFTTGASVHFRKAIDCNLEWVAQAPGGPDKLKQFSAATFHFRRKDFWRAEGTFATEISTTEQSPDLVFSDRTFTGTAQWESRALPRNKRILVPRPNVAAYLAPGFKIREAKAVWALNGITIHYEDSGDGNSR